MLKHLHIYQYLSHITLRQVIYLPEASVSTSLGQKDPLEKQMATHSSILACRIPWTEEPGRL